ncbi:MAG: HAD family hydrolase [Bacteroidetes bacterium]|nr:MAG: HAD family hydrolase [Bacteroidota bacterium]
MKEVTDCQIFLIDIGDTLVHIQEPFEIYTRQAIRNIEQFFESDDTSRFVETVFNVRQQIRAEAHRSLREFSFSFFIEEVSRIFSPKYHNLTPDRLQEIENAYIRAELNITRIFPDTPDFLRQLQAQGKQMVIATNNFSSLHVYQLLEKFALTDLFQGIYISGEIGWRKPHPKFLTHIADNFPGFNREKAIIIGDKPEMDVALANNGKIKSIWLNRKNIQNVSFIPTIEVHSLSDIKF